MQDEVSHSRPTERSLRKCEPNRNKKYSKLRAKRGKDEPFEMDSRSFFGVVLLRSSRL
jgi:hypothetical protein